MKTYRVWGEYGPVAYMTIEYTVQAESREAARKGPTVERDRLLGPYRRT